MKQFLECFENWILSLFFFSSFSVKCKTHRGVRCCVFFTGVVVRVIGGMTFDWIACSPTGAGRERNTSFPNGTGGCPMRLATPALVLPSPTRLHWRTAFRFNCWRKNRKGRFFFHLFIRFVKVYCAWGERESNSTFGRVPDDFADSRSPRLEGPALLPSIYFTSFHFYFVVTKNSKNVLFIKCEDELYFGEMRVIIERKVFFKVFFLMLMSNYTLFTIKKN